MNVANKIQVRANIYQFIKISEYIYVNKIVFLYLLNKFYEFQFQTIRTGD